MGRPGTLFLASVVVGAVAFRAGAQSNEYRLEGEKWVASRVPEAGSDEGVIASARQHLARGDAYRARRILDDWLDEHEHLETNAWVPVAYLLRGDAHLARGREEAALADYEEVVKRFPESDSFPIALEREHQVALKYLGGLRRKVLGFRLDSGIPLAEEILLRVCERLPRSRLAERSLLALADYYYAARELRLAVDCYDVFLILYGPKWWEGQSAGEGGAAPPSESGLRQLLGGRRGKGTESEFSTKAIQRLTYSYIAKFKGPRYDSTPLEDARTIIRKARANDPTIFEKDGIGEALEARLEESMAAQMLDTARFYLKRDDPVSARLTLRRLVKRHDQTAAAARGREMLAARGWSVESGRPKATKAAAPKELEEAPEPGKGAEDAR